MRRTTAAAVAAVLAAGLAGCSSKQAAQTSGTTSPTAAAVAVAAAAPSSAECSAVAKIVNANMSALEVGNASMTDQDQQGAYYYQQLVAAIQSSGATDPESAAVLGDAQHLENAYTSVAEIDDGPASSTMSADLQTIEVDLGNLLTDQTAFDADCEIPTIEPT